MAGAALPISGDRSIVQAKFPDPPLIETVFLTAYPETLCSSPRRCNQDAVSSTPLHPISSHFLY